MLEKLYDLQLALDKTLTKGRNSYEYGIVRPKLLKELKQTIEEARASGTTESDIDELVFILEAETGKRPIELENFWDPRRLSKTWRRP